MCDSVQPHRRQPTRLPIPGILQARTLEWVPLPSPMFKMSHWIWEGSFWSGRDSRDFSTATGPHDCFFRGRTSKKLPQVVGLYKPPFSSAADSSDILLAVHKGFPSDRMKFGLETRVQIAVFSTFQNMLSKFSSVQSLSRVRHFAIPWTAARQASLSITNSRSPPRPMCIESVMPSNYLILCCPLLLQPSIFPRISLFQ